MNTVPCRRRRILIPLAVLAFVSLLSFAVHALWNGVLAEVLGVKLITYWQALGLLALSKILFGGFPGGCRGFGGRAREHMLARHWESLDPEQRERLREEMRQRFGDWPRPSWCTRDRTTPAADERPPGA